MKVAVSVFDNILECNGTLVRAAAVRDALAERWDVTLLVAKAGAGQTPPGEVRCIGVPRTRLALQAPVWMPRLLAVVLRERFDVVVCSRDWFGFCVLHPASRVRGFRLLFEAHAILSAEYRSLGRSKAAQFVVGLLERHVISNAGTVIGLSRNTVRFYERYRRDIELVPPFIDVGLFRRDERRRRELRAAYGVSSKLIGLIGPFDAKFNEHFVTFLRHNIDRFDERIQFMAIGKCEEAKKARRDRVVYTGWVDDYVGHLCSLDAVLLPVRIATTGPCTKILEAMSMGLPVFTTPAGLTGLDHVTPGEDILVFDEGELVDKVHELVFDEQRLGMIGANARRTVEAYYSRSTSAAKVRDIVSRVAGTRQMDDAERGSDGLQDQGL